MRRTLSLFLASCAPASTFPTPTIPSAQAAETAIATRTPNPPTETLAATATPIAPATAEATATQKPATPKPTKEPTIAPTQAATLAPPTNTREPPPPPPAGGYNFQKEGNQYICRSCPFDTNLIHSPNIIQIALTAGDASTQTVTYQNGNLSPAQFEQEYQRLLSEGYKPISMGIWQAEDIGDPAVVGIKPHGVWYIMRK